MIEHRYGGEIGRRARGRGGWRRGLAAEGGSEVESGSRGEGVQGARSWDTYRCVEGSGDGERRAI